MGVYEVTHKKSAASDSFDRRELLSLHTSRKETCRETSSTSFNRAGRRNRCLSAADNSVDHSRAANEHYTAGADSSTGRLEHTHE